MIKLKIFYFLNGRYGGVYSVVKSIIQHSNNKNIEHHIINILGLTQKTDFNYVDFVNTEHQRLFHYNSNNNLFNTYKELSKLLPNSHSIIVANDWLELGMISLLGLNNPVIHIVHGNYEYYFDLVKKHYKAVNSSICICDTIYNNLLKNYPEVINKATTIKYPISNYNYSTEKLPGVNIVFVAADLKCPNKNISIINSINTTLEKANVFVHWHIVGNGFTQSEICEWWNGSNNLTYYGFLSSHGLNDLYSKTNLFLLASFNEGLPVSMIEAMSFKLVPLVNSWNKSAESIISNGYNGYIVNSNAPIDYAQKIIHFYNNPDSLIEIGNNAINTINEQYDCSASINMFENKFIEVSQILNHRLPNKVYGSRLDNKFIPNWLTRSIRAIMKLHG